MANAKSSCEFCNKKIRHCWRNTKKNTNERTIHDTCIKRRDELNKHIKEYLEIKRQYIEMKKKLNIDDMD